MIYNMNTPKQTNPVLTLAKKEARARMPAKCKKMFFER
jgi:hypothetical protein